MRQNPDHLIASIDNTDCSIVLLVFMESKEYLLVYISEGSVLNSRRKHKLQVEFHFESNMIG